MEVRAERAMADMHKEKTRRHERPDEETTDDGSEAESLTSSGRSSCPPAAPVVEAAREEQIELPCSRRAGRRQRQWAPTSGALTISPPAVAVAAQNVAPSQPQSLRERLRATGGMLLAQCAAEPVVPRPRPTAAPAAAQTWKAPPGLHNQAQHQQPSLAPLWVHPESVAPEELGAMYGAPGWEPYKVHVPMYECQSDVSAFDPFEPLKKHIPAYFYQETPDQTGRALSSVF